MQATRWRRQAHETHGTTTRRAVSALVESEIPWACRTWLSMPRRGTLLFDRRFRVQCELGRGSMGVVYRAFDTVRNRDVALKMCGQPDGPALYELKQEFRVAARLRHRNLVRFYGLFGNEQAWFITMELVQGDPLLRHLRLHPGWDRFRDVFGQVASGIAAIHSAGKLHRDLKPENVLVTPEGRAVILDFGLVADKKLGGVGQTLPRVMGTPAYMAPEQAAGQPATETSDWYAFGALLYEALTGQLPVSGTAYEVLQAKQLVDPASPSALGIDVPADLEKLCMGLVAREPAARPSSRAVLDAFGRPPATPRRRSSPRWASGVRMRHNARGLTGLRAALEATDRGRASVVLLHGASARDRSALVEHFVKEAEQEQPVVLRSRCSRQESIPFKACDSLVDALCHYLRGLDEHAAQALMPRHVRALTELFPVLSRVDAAGSTPRRSPVPSDPDKLRAQAVDALRELLGRLAERTRLVVVIEELQHGDEQSVELLTRVLEQPDPPPLLLVCTHPASAPAARLLEPLTSCAREREDVTLYDVRTAS